MKNTCFSVFNRLIKIRGVFLYFSSLIFLLLMILLLVSFHSIKVSYNEISVLKSDIEFYKINNNLNYRYVGSCISDSLLKNNNELVKQDASFNSSNKLILFYPSEACSSCFESHLNEILSIVDSLKLLNNRFNLFTNYENTRLTKIFQERISYQCKVFNIYRSLDNSLLSIKFPLLIVVNEGLVIKRICLVSTSNYSSTRDFVNAFLEDPN
jgi:hypothetical protein